MTDSCIPVSQLSRQTRETVWQYQQQSLRELLHYAWKHSSFYREFYGSHDIKEKDLGEVTVRDLPFLSKQILMENFDTAVTDPRLKKKEVEEWIYSHPDPCQNYRDHFIVVHTSGSSGNIGIFVYDQKAWRVANRMMAGRLPTPENYPSEKTRAAFYLASHGHFGGVSTAARMPKSIYDTVILSLLDSRERVVKQLNDFQPHRLHGYSSSVFELAELAIQGKLHIHPQSIIVSGDKLTADMEEKIQEAWRPRIYVLYSASESKYIAVKEARQDEMRVMDDLNIVEVLDEDNRPVSSGGEGRVVLTNLHTYTLPILRYELGDYAVMGTSGHDALFTGIRDIRGRVNDALPVVLHDGSHDSIHPIILSEFYVPGLERVQFISYQSDQVQIDYIATHNIEAAVRLKFQHILSMKGASRTTFEVRRVQHIPNDPQTGKLRLVKIEHDQVYQPSESIPDLHLKEAVSAGRVCPTSPSLEFKTEEVEESVPDRFEQQVAKYPNQLAIKTRNCALTYDAANKAANLTARAVLEKRRESEEPIALLFDHDAPMIVALLGVLKAGKICVVLDPSYPEARASYILGDSQAKLIVTNSKNLPLARKFARPGQQLIINIDEIDPNFSAENLGLPISPDAIACILYTSGSTGQPKGVVQNHRNVIHNAMRYANGCRISAEDRVTLLASLGTGQATPTAFSALLSGATLHPYNIREEGVAGLSSWLNTEKITVYISAPTLFRQFVVILTGDEKFLKLRMIRLGAEQIQKRDVELYRKHFPAHCTFAIFLSATEAGNLCQYFVDKETEIASDIVPVGYAVNGVEILLLDDAGKEIGFGEIGEIAVKSRYLSPGYWRRPDLTQAAFLPDPKGGDERIYRTGDLGRMRPDGCLEHLGRKDFQVKIRGFRIELGEIEALLRKHPAIQETVIEAREEESKGNRLTAYVVPVQGEAPTVSELCNYLKEKLPDYMVPSAFVFLDSLPLTSAGKVDRRALPEPGNTRPGLDTAYVPPRTPLEEEVAKIWAKVLSLDRIGIHDNFFELGGHSLLGVELIAQIQRDLQANLPLRFLLEFPTVAQLAARIKATRDEGFYLQEEKGNYLVNLGPGQNQTPVFYFPYMGGFRADLLTFARLVRLIGSDYSFYGLQARGTDGVSQPHRFVEDMAADYIEAIQTLQPHGPYFLVGECFSAAVAYETAQQLWARGEKVALLAFLDAKCSRQSLGRYLWRRLSARLRYRIQPISESWASAAFHLREIERLERGKRLRYFFDKMGKAIMVIYYVLRGVWPLHPQWANIDGGDAERRKSKHVQRAQKGYSLAIMRYRLRPYEGRITLLVNEEWYRSDPNLRWADLAAGGVEVHKIPGNHFTYITENVQVVAKELRECLDRASYCQCTGHKNRVEAAREARQGVEEIFTDA